MMAQPRGFTKLMAHDVVIHVLGEFAIVHARITYQTDDGVTREGRYTTTISVGTASGSASLRTSSLRGSDSPSAVAATRQPKSLPAEKIRSIGAWRVGAIN